jgi:Tfp pilus assembly protein PilO
MNRFNLLNSIPIVIIISLVITFVLGILFLWPKFQEMEQLNQKINSKQEELQYNEQYFNELESIKEKLGENETEVSKIDSALPDEKSLPSLFDLIQRISSQTGLIFKTLSPFAASYSEDIPEIQEIRFSIVLSGSYSSFKSFLSSLETSARMIEVENISFASEGEEPFNFNLKLKVYSY